MNKKKKFLEELKYLLEKYGAEIDSLGYDVELSIIFSPYDCIDFERPSIDCDVITKILESK